MVKENRKLNPGHKKVSDAGYSLVELLIAVTILAIIVIPLLHMFVTSTKVNVKSRQMLRATTVAQDIMEGLKAYTLEEVRTQFTPPDGVGGSSFFYPSEGFYVVNSNMVKGGVREITELENPDSDSPDKEIYYFGIENLTMQGGEYDALIKLDASTYTESKVGTDPTAHDNVFNGAFFAQVGSVSETNGGSDTDSSYHENKKLNEAVLKDVKQQIENDVNAVGGTLPDDWDELGLCILEDASSNADPDEITLTSRVIDVVISDAGSKDAEGNSECSAAITFTYMCKYNGNTYTSYGYAGSEAGLVNGISRTFSSGNFYLFYYPAYSLFNKIDQINITIKNSDRLLAADSPMLKSITLAKQIRSDVDVEAGIIAPNMTDTELWSAETSYKAEVKISVDLSAQSQLIFKTNIDTNMAEKAKHVDSAGEVTRDDVGGINFIYVPATLAFGNKIRQVALTGSNAGDKITNVIYDIEITVYEAGAARYFKDPDFESKDEVHKLATITNLN